MERLALIGLGKIAGHHLRALETLLPRDTVEVIGGFDIDRDRAPGYLDRPLPVFGSLAELLAAGPTSILVTTPTTDHYRTCRRVLDTVSHPVRLIVEKPVSDAPAEVEELLSGSPGTEVVAIYHAAHAPEVLWAAAHVERWRSEHGDITGFTASFADPYRELDRATRDRVYVNSWFDSGINALSVALRLVPLRSVERVGLLDAANSVYDARVTFGTGPADGDGGSGSGSGQGDIRTSWDVSEPAKTSEFRFADGTVLALDHQRVRGSLRREGRRPETFEDTEPYPRLVRHYQNAFGSLFVEHDGYYTARQSRLLHRLLFAEQPVRDTT